MKPRYLTDSPAGSRPGRPASQVGGRPATVCPSAASRSSRSRSSRGSFACTGALPADPLHSWILADCGLLLR